MEMLVLIVHVLVAAGIVGLVLVQHGKGADMGAAFGSGSAGSVFGSAGSANFFSRMTAVLALVFFLTSMGLTWLANKRGVDKGVMAAPAASKPADKAPGTPDIPAVPSAKSEKGDKATKGDNSVPAVPTEAPKTGDAPK